MRSCTTPLNSKSLPLDKESRGISFRKTSIAQRSSIRIFPKNISSLKPLVKSLWTLSNPSRSGKPSVGTKNCKKLTKGGLKR